jgi:hypothetical protein
MEENKHLSKEEVIQLVAVLSDQEKHFNGLETNYRLLSSTWLLGSLGTVGYLLISTDQLTIDFWLLIGLIGAAAGVGIILLWMLDVRVYHKLLNAVFIQGILLEIQYDWLPRARTDMLMLQKGDVTKSTNLYYTLSSASLFSISLTGFIKYANETVTGITIGVLGAMVIITAMVFLWRSVRSERTDKLVKYLDKNYKDQVDGLDS